jgi:tetratricopeptide (TPR) repeat protein
LLVYDWDWAGAAREAERALDLNPNSADAHAVKGNYFVVLGRGRESVTELNRALRLDPLSLGDNFAAGWAHYMAREYEPAIEQFRRTVEMEPSFGWAHEGLAITHVQLGRCPEAIAEAEKGANVDNSPLVLAMAGGVYASCERADAARDVLTKLAEISRTRYVCPYEIAIVQIGLGDKDEAFRYLEKGFRDRSVCMPFTKVDPRLDPIRSDPRYGELVRRLAFPA